MLMVHKYLPNIVSHIVDTSGQHFANLMDDDTVEDLRGFRIGRMEQGRLVYTSGEPIVGTLEPIRLDPWSAIFIIAFVAVVAIIVIIATAPH